MHLTQGLTPLLALLGNLAVADARRSSDAAAELPPSRDPWYTLPAGADCTGSPGKVLRLRRAPKSTRDSLRGIQDAWNVLFCSTDSLGLPTFSVTTVLVPRLADRASLATYAPAYDSASVDSSPSFAFRDLPSASVEQALFAPLLVAKRWVLNVPDYEGPRAAYLAGNNSGHGVLDSMRAVASLRETIGLREGYRQAVYGYSGGAFAAQWAAQLQPGYAPELQVGAAAYGGLPVNATAAIQSVNGGPSAGLVVLALLGTTAQDPAARAVLVDNLRKTGPFNATTLLGAAALDVKAGLALFKNQDIAEYFVDGFSFLRDPAFVRAFYDDTLAGHADTPTIPLYVFHAVKDELSPSRDMDELVEKYCAAGARIRYRRNTVGDHTAEGVVEGIRALNWLGRFFKERTVDGGGGSCSQRCITQNVAVPLGPDTLALVFAVFGQQGLSIARFLQAHPLPGIPPVPPTATNANIFAALNLTSRAALTKIGLDDKRLAEFYVSDQDLAELGIH
ncbi:lipase [Cordyceps fumosorosea ARSEF 2679]|uniref:Lipase n=1 Tax=Cordyceps fumosorosea (strain ARSEF 2679) TaxID=1081104 RepID=A0A167UD98_CORFA|nr:lipase [Cordyceps fumosorosea ARSEF 2679]OAA61471.1 lipase [Cordyceps fumosorosea ARSEF 2679]